MAQKIFDFLDGSSADGWLTSWGLGGWCKF